MSSIPASFDDLLDVSRSCGWVRGGFYGDDPRKEIVNEIWELISESKSNGDSIEPWRCLKRWVEEGIRLEKVSRKEGCEKRGPGKRTTKGKREGTEPTFKTSNLADDCRAG